MPRLLSPAAAESASPFDFRRPPRVPRMRQVAIQGVYDRFAQSLQALFSSRLRRPTDVVVQRVEQELFGEFVTSLPDPCAAFVFDLGGSTAGQGILNFENAFAFLLIDRLFGGPGNSGDFARALTQLERLVVNHVTDRILGDLRDSWEEHVRMRPRQTGFEAMPDTLQIVSREESVLVAELEVRSGQATGMMTVCLPWHALEKFLQEKGTRHMLTAPGADTARAQSRPALESAVRNVGVPVTVRFPPFLLRTSDLAQLEVGTVLRSGHPADAPLEVRVARQVRFLGSLGQSRGALGLRVTHLFDEAPTESTFRGPRGRIQ